MDPISIVMIVLIGVLVIFMFRNGKKRQQAMQKLQNGLRPGAGVMLQSGIFGVVESVDDENNRVTILSGDSSLVVHRNAVGQIIDPVEAPEETEPTVAPDDDPEFGERVIDVAEPPVAEQPVADEPGRPVIDDGIASDPASTDADAPSDAEAPKRDTASGNGDAPEGGDTPKP